jgi:hypothetical protein
MGYYCIWAAATADGREVVGETHRPLDREGQPGDRELGELIDLARETLRPGDEAGDGLALAAIDVRWAEAARRWRDGGLEISADVSLDGTVVVTAWSPW